MNGEIMTAEEYAELLLNIEKIEIQKFVERFPIEWEALKARRGHEQ